MHDLLRSGCRNNSQVRTLLLNDMANYGRHLDWEELAPYAGRWVAIVRGIIVGIGWTSEEAFLAARRSRPGDDPELMFVPAVEVDSGDFGTE